MVNLLKVVLAANLCFVQLAVAHPKESKSDTTPAFQFPGYPSDQSYELVYVDPETHSLVHKKVDGVSKRGRYEDPVVSIIRKNKPEKFCRSYCPSQCASSKPQVKTIKSTTTVCTTTTATVCPYGCKTTVLSTVTAPRPVATVTRASTTVLTRLSTVRAPTSTILTTVTDTSTVTEVTTTTTTSVIPIGFKGDTPAPRGLDERDARVPSYLRRYSRQQICNACAAVYPPRRGPTQTVKKVVTATKTATQDDDEASFGHHHQGLNLYAVTHDPHQDDAHDRDDDALHNDNALNDKDHHRTHNDDDDRGGHGNSHHLRTTTANHSAGCCVACFRYQGCQSWAFLKARDTNWCTIVVEFNFGDGTATAECPAGRGGGQFLFAPSGSEGSGGPGQCSA
ncbi:hypothetical protein D7B24_004780 [Verticillium nonalfalfae]|uniref:Apple domain-containing protein n=1 Tax=Verticillium nonalfalfae TaxID=1051616 RepID=A0A3M9YFH3_9PEZI|nr:uncharacterized protein D7B24_004780 [Verticillium nonalfalfae]RNJ58328.1 hypothetical protein D7B24_004780 [Verticillium nonalfalfae]